MCQYSGLIQRQVGCFSHLLPPRPTTAPSLGYPSPANSSEASKALFAFIISLKSGFSFYLNLALCKQDFTGELLHEEAGQMQNPPHSLCDHWVNCFAHESGISPSHPPLPRLKGGYLEPSTQAHLVVVMWEEEALLEGKSYLSFGSTSLKRMDPAAVSSVDRARDRG